MPNPRWTFDRKLAKGKCGIVGVDEAGRGCLAGPVVAGCVILPAAFFKDSIINSKIKSTQWFQLLHRAFQVERYILNNSPEIDWRFAAHNTVSIFPCRISSAIIRTIKI